ncbi:MAG TPA: SMP-30/gluconolactonase/LRE family protein [Bryobacteraceae bacterium]|nr:SMP-30/gluconolactonase/LRE family protein [Bryobacteraceae bacterium]
MRALFALLFATRVFAQEFGHLEVQRVVANLHFAEGPVWSYDGFLVFSDTVVDKLFKVIPGGADQVFAERAGGAIGNAYDAEGRLYSCEFRQRRVTRTLKNGKVEVLAARFEGKRFNAPNDIVVRRDGQVYFTDPAFGAQQDTRELDFYGVYHLTPKGELELVAKWRTRPNGIALSPNGRTLYVSDSDERNVRAYDLDGKGAASKERIVVDKIDGVPDGLRTDENGNLYVAANKVYVYGLSNDPAKLLGEIPLAETPSNLAFGDADMETLYITARTSVYRVRLGVKGALPY